MWNRLSSVFGNSPAPAKGDTKGDAKADPTHKSAVTAHPIGGGAHSAANSSKITPLVLNTGAAAASPAPTKPLADTSKVVAKASSNARYLHKLKDYALLMEYRLLKQRAPSGVYVIPAVETLRRWHGVIVLRHGFYRRGIFKFVIHIPEAYPYAAPRVYFLSKVFNPHINYKTGELDLKPQFPEWKSNEHYMELLLVYIKKVFYRSECWTFAPADPAAATTDAAANTIAPAAAAAGTAAAASTTAAPAVAAAPAGPTATANILALPMPASPSASAAANTPLVPPLSGVPPASPIAVKGLHQAPATPMSGPTAAPGHGQTTAVSANANANATAAFAAVPGTLPVGYQCYNKLAHTLWVENKREFLNCCEETVRWSCASKLLYESRFDVAALNATIIASVPEAKRQSQLLLRQSQQHAAAVAAAHAHAHGEIDAATAAAAGATGADDDDDGQCVGLSTNATSALRFTQPQAAHQQILERIFAAGANPDAAAPAAPAAAFGNGNGNGSGSVQYINWFLDGVQRLDSTPAVYKA